MRHKKGMVCMMLQKSSTKVRDMIHDAYQLAGL